MIKCSFLNQIIIYLSFYGALLTFSYFFHFKEKIIEATTLLNTKPRSTLYLVQVF